MVDMSTRSSFDKMLRTNDLLLIIARKKTFCVRKKPEVWITRDKKFGEIFYRELGAALHFADIFHLALQTNTEYFFHRISHIAR